MDAATLLFLNNSRRRFRCTKHLRTRSYDNIPIRRSRCRNLNIIFKSLYVCLCIVCPGKKEKELPDPYLVVTLGMSYPLESSRVAVKTEPYPGRWTTHIVLGDEKEVDGELLKWVVEAYDFANTK